MSGRVAAATDVERPRVLCGDAEERSHTARVELGIGIRGGDRRRTTKGRDLK